MSDLTDAAFKTQRLRLRKLVTRWKEVLGLEHWHIEHEFLRGPIPGEDDGANGWSAALARGWPDFRYLHAKIQWSMAAVADVDDEDLQGLVIHELTHCLTDAFKRYALHEDDAARPMGIPEMERQVTEIEHALIWAYAAGQKAARAKKVTIAA